MRTTLLASAALLGLGVSSAYAQLGNTLSPAAPNASSQGPQPTNSLPVGGPTSSGSAAGSSLGGGPTSTAPNYTNAAPTPPPATTRRVRRARRRAPVTSSELTPMATPMVRTVADEYRGGVGSPLSKQATDLTPSTKARIGSRLPSPDASANDPHDLLVAAQKNLDQGKTGAAQQALEMAETRVLSRTVDPSLASQPDTAGMVRNIAQARQALGSRDLPGAKKAVMAALQEDVPPPGPAVTTIPGTPVQ